MSTKTMRIAFIVGARPQFVKMAAMHDAIAEYNRHARERQVAFEEIIINTGQHYDAALSDIFFNELNIPRPHYQLGCGSGSHATQTGNIMIAVEAALKRIEPDMVVVFGDTNTTMAGALAAKKLKFPLVHIEAGLRSFDLTVAEEINRVATDHIADILCCPTLSTLANCQREGLGQRAFFSGDVMFDCFVRHYDRIKNTQAPPLFTAPKGGYFVSTIHRADATESGSTLRELMYALGELPRKVYMPMHPRTRNAFHQHDVEVPHNVELLPPLGYFDMAALLSRSQIVLTDSSGVQKEAFFWQRPCVVIRRQREWTETINSGWAVVAGTSADDIMSAVAQFQRARPNEPTDGLFGDGNAGRKVLDALSQGVGCAAKEAVIAPLALVDSSQACPATDRAHPRAAITMRRWSGERVTI
jgi:UDP-GlcNAc3NAcA epimerase